MFVGDAGRIASAERKTVRSPMDEPEKGLGRRFAEALGDALGELILGIDVRVRRVKNVISPKCVLIYTSDYSKFDQIADKISRLFRAITNT